jgi:subtilase family serine protease
VLAIVLLWSLAALACGGPSNQPSRLPQARNPVSSPPPATLSAAIGKAVHLGPAGTGTEVNLTLGLKVRRANQLAALLAAGQTMSPAEYEAQFGPDPALAKSAVALLVARGFQATWGPGSGLIAADGSAPRAALLLGIDIENYRLADGTTFYASLDKPRLPPQLTAIVGSVTGLDSYRHARTYAVRPGGLTPTDVLAFYNLKPLRDRGLDGAGETIVLPEIDNLPNLNDLNRFASKFGLTPFDPLLTIKRNANWGTPMAPAGEVAMDLEIIHAVAPKAKLVVYLSSPRVGQADRAFDQMVTDHLGSIISESLGECEPDASSGHRSLYAGIQNRAVAEGMGHYVASGDNGAYECGEDVGPTASFPATLPNITAVGGTTVFESLSGLYFKEAAWGAPISQAGAGGGTSVFYALPDFQKIVAQSAGQGRRQVPDVSANADPETGFSIVFGGQLIQAAGTSASTPLWAGTVALIEQDLKQKGYRAIGFANPALYWMGQNSSKLPAPPFHDVTAGNNLAYDAGPGWDFATGWGSMDADALDKAWVIYKKGGGA